MKPLAALSRLPAEVTFSPDGAAAFVANGGSASVSVIDAGTLTVTETIAVGETPVGAWPGADGPFAALHSRPDDGRPARVG